MTSLHHGFLVKVDGYYGIVVSVGSKKVTVFLGNGTLQEFKDGELQVVNLPTSEAPHSFHEIMRAPKVRMDLGPLFGLE